MKISKIFFNLAENSHSFREMFEILRKKLKDFEKNLNATESVLLPKIGHKKPALITNQLRRLVAIKYVWRMLQGVMN